MSRALPTQYAEPYVKSKKIRKTEKTGNVLGKSPLLFVIDNKGDFLHWLFFL